MKFDEILFNRSNDALRPALKYLSVKPNPLPTRKADMAQLIREEMTDLTRLRAQWTALDNLERAAVAEALYDGGELDTVAFKALHGGLPSLSTSGYGRDAPRLSLFFDYNWRLADELIPLLKSWVPKPESYHPTEIDELPRSVTPHGWAVNLMRADTEPIAFHDLTATLLMVRDGKLKVSDQTSLPGAATTRALTSRLLLPDYYGVSEGARAADFIRPFGLIVLVQASKLAKKRGDQLVLTPAGEAWLAHPDVSQFKSVVDAWAQSSLFDELRRVNQIKGQQSHGEALSVPSLRRKAILRTLEDCTPGKWLHVNDFFKLVKLTRNNFSVETGNVTHLYAFDQEYGWFGSMSSETYWRVVQGQYILVVMFEYLATLGLVDVAYVTPEEARYEIEWLWGYDDQPYFSRYEGLQYIRLTPLGAYVLGMTEDYTPAAVSGDEPVLKVLPNRQIVIAHREGLQPNDRAMIERIAQYVSDDVYQIEAAMLLDAFETGLTEPTATDFLETKSSNALPQTVATLFSDVSANSHKVERLGEAMMFRAADAALAALLANDRELKAYCLLAGDDVVVVPVAKQNAFRKRIKQLGYGIARG